MSTHPRLHARRSTVGIVLVGLFLSTTVLAAGDEPAEPSCPFNPDWILSPDAVDEVGFSEDDGKDSSFCDFYQFSWRNFLHLVSPQKGSASTSGNAYPAIFLDSRQYLSYTSDETVNPCTEKAPEHTFFGTMPTGLEPRDWKSLDDPDIYQAGSKAVIYDQNGNAAIYSTRFSRNLCDVRTVLPHPYFPAGTTELKMAWRVLTDKDDSSLYYTVDAPPGALGRKAGTAKLGLIGFHIAIVTDAHPEMIWITLEHNLNDPLCEPASKTAPEPIASHAYSFTSAKCAKPGSGCTFNEPEQFKGKDEKAELTGTPTEICQQYPFGQLPDGIDPTDNDNPANQAAISELYSAFTSYVENPENDTEATQWAKVWTNYRMVGALWLSQPYSADPRLFPDRFNSSDCDENMEHCYDYGNPGDGTHQRGSLALANSVAETDFQGPVDALDKDGQSRLRNCFGCHQFTTNDVRFVRPIERVLSFAPGADSEQLNRGSGTISHIFPTILAKQCNVSNTVPMPGYKESFDPEDPQQVEAHCREQCAATPFPVWTGRFRFFKSTDAECECCAPPSVPSH